MQETDVVSKQQALHQYTEALPSFVDNINKLVSLGRS